MSGLRSHEFKVEQSGFMLRRARQTDRTRPRSLRPSTWKKQNSSTGHRPIRRVPADAIGFRWGSVFDRKGRAQRQRFIAKGCLQGQSRRRGVMYMNADSCGAKAAERGEKCCCVRKRNCARRFSGHDSRRKHLTEKGESVRTRLFVARQWASLRSAAPRLAI